MNLDYKAKLESAYSFMLKHSKLTVRLLFLYVLPRCYLVKLTRVMCVGYPRRSGDPSQGDQSQLTRADLL